MPGADPSTSDKGKVYPRGRTKSANEEAVDYLPSIWEVRLQERPKGLS